MRVGFCFFAENAILQLNDCRSLINQFFEFSPDSNDTNQNNNNKQHKSMIIL